MIGGKKYTQADIVEGRKILRNGAVAGYVLNQQGKRVWRIVDASGVNMNALRAAPRAAKKISPRAAKIAFNKYYKNRKGTARGNKAARTYDLNHTQNVVDDARYRRSPHKYDFAGVDTGSKVRAARSEAQKAHDANLANKAWRAEHNMRGGKRGRKAGSRNVSKVCGVNPKTNRCSKAHAGRQGELCKLRRKSKRCAKNVHGRATLPKNQANVARGRALRSSLKDRLTGRQ